MSYADEHGGQRSIGACAKEVPVSFVEVKLLEITALVETPDDILNKVESDADSLHVLVHGLDEGFVFESYVIGG